MWFVRSVFFTDRTNSWHSSCFESSPGARLGSFRQRSRTPVYGYQFETTVPSSLQPILAQMGTSSARKRVGVFCRREFHLGTEAQLPNRVGLSNRRHEG